ncbi:hypothetical protein TRFO_17593 [Tritrichomonas foetus]|uniref:Initiator binding domain-containing protein n=1 Tax=Tritrichomonas foetus TaxID=1144522 RepID=A0A1J4KMK8_9EUKA|nr:hypothetical protein TRFO_17593 [Tritrichomonas foetus]|eukprot:OHT12543.1 hypothetical protein TRFO_17593 [Tritrichomonas foetus]
MSMELNTAEELRSFLLKDPVGMKQKFAAKLFLTLQFTQKFPTLISITGACWLKDGVRFIANSQIFGQFIGLKPNSVNANFRSHFFKMHQYSASEISKEFSLLKDPRNYKVRSNLTYHFSLSSTLKQVNSIPCDSPQAQQLKINLDKHTNSKIPDFLFDFVKNDEEIHLKIELIFKKIPKTEEWKYRFFFLAMREWRSITNELSTDISNILKYIDQNINSQLCSNISFLFNQQTGSSSTDSFITFDTYIQFIARYGFLRNCKVNISALSTWNTNLINDNNFSIDECGVLVPRFKKWFKPHYNETNAVSHLDDMPNNSWVVRPSTSFGTFTLHSKRLRGYIATHLNYDPLSIENGFSILVEGSKTVFASSWEELLFGVMKLPRNEEEISSGETGKHTIYVSADEFLGPDKLLQESRFIPVQMF